MVIVVCLEHTAEWRIGIGSKYIKQHCPLKINHSLILLLNVKPLTLWQEPSLRHYDYSIWVWSWNRTINKAWPYRCPVNAEYLSWLALLFCYKHNSPSLAELLVHCYLKSCYLYSNRNLVFYWTPGLSVALDVHHVRTNSSIYFFFEQQQLFGQTSCPTWPNLCICQTKIVQISLFYNTICLLLDNL